ncbi:uncharacterized protein si:dkeyp-69c1.9 [Leucoraja erinacea]|uniref:uncharacterized protein si:dkeyp-69c1.9 n=1 Tax=Leucoraja erinaceus TaxID=7782 RepID=UPI00245436C0|nr:uncharacterized protein si:dkeyp-69c1.9 [Leucoraja erinacea]
MALNYLRKLEDMEFSEFSCLCELCDCGQHKYHQNCKKKQSIQRRSVSTDWLLTNYQSSFRRPLNVLPRSSKRPLRTPPHPNPPAMQSETTQRSEFGPRVPREQTKAGNRPLQEQLHSKSIHTKGLTLKERPATVQKCLKGSLPSSRSSSRSNTSCKGWKSEPSVRSGERLTASGCQCPPYQNNIQQPTRKAEIRENFCNMPERAKPLPDNLKFEGVHDLNTTYQVEFQPLPFARQKTVRKRTKPKPAPMDLLSSYRKDYPEHKQSKMLSIIPAQDNLQVNRHLPADFNTIQKNSYIGWDPTQYPRPDPIKYKDQLNVEGAMETTTVTKLEYNMKPSIKKQEIHRPTTQQSLGGKFDPKTSYAISYKDWDPKTRIRYGDPHDKPFEPPSGRIESTSVTGRDFTPKNVCHPPNYSPCLRKNTSHHQNARSSPLPMCKLQAYLIHQHLKNMKISNRSVPVTCVQ